MDDWAIHLGSLFLSLCMSAWFLAANIKFEVMGLVESRPSRLQWYARAQSCSQVTSLVNPLGRDDTGVDI